MKNDYMMSYDDVYLIPKYSSLNSRDDADTSVFLCGYKFNIPVVPANMVDVISFENAKFLSNSGYFYIMHRFNNITPQFIKWANQNELKIVSVSVGVKEIYNDLSEAKEKGYRIDFITIDVAHAHHKNVKGAVDEVKKLFPKSKLIIGNVATADGVSYLIDLGADIIKCGLGGGSICSTKHMTGFHIPTLQSVAYANEVMMDIRGWDVPIIADGGAKHYGDIAKAIRFGASMVMSGGWFASCIDSPAKIINGKKLYRGSTSYELKGHNHHIEGRQLELLEGTTYEQRLTEIKEAIQSSISYAGGQDLSAFETLEYGRILPYS